MKITRLGDMGVSVDKADMDMADNEFRASQNMIGGYSVDGIGTRQGLTAVNASVAAGAILGGCHLPFPDLSGVQDGSGTVIYLGRGPTS